MLIATVNGSGQVTIPIEVRERLGLGPGSRLTFVPTRTGGYEISSATGSIKDLKGVVPSPAQPVSVARMNEATAGVDAS